MPLFIEALKRDGKVRCLQMHSREGSWDGSCQDAMLDVLPSFGTKRPQSSPVTLNGTNLQQRNE